LLWREYPSDQSGSYFRQFWDVSDVINRNPDPNPDALKAFEESLRDIKELHTWGIDSALGSHENRSLPTGRKPDPQAGQQPADIPDEERKLVLVIRGELPKRYPTAMIFLQEAKWVEENGVFIRKLNQDDPKIRIKEPVFKAQIEPDLYFLGFDLTIKEAEGNTIPPPEGEEPGWFVVIQERPGEPRFGLDLKDEDDPLLDVTQLSAWNQLTWDHLGDPNEIPFINVRQVPKPAVVGGDTESPNDLNITWDSNAADMAYILYQVPVMVAIHAANMLPEKKVV
jgi:hypothetical protein